MTQHASFDFFPCLTRGFLRFGVIALGVTLMACAVTEQGTGVVALAEAAPGSAQDGDSTQRHNMLTEQQRAEGWRLLFDGESTDGWRRFNAQGIGSAWEVVAGTLHLNPRERDGWQTVNGGDIVTRDEFGNYEFYMEWKLSDAGNSGLMYKVVEGEEYSYAWETGPEYQLLDNDRHPDGVNLSRRTGDLYDIKASRLDAVHPIGQWNRTRLIVRDGYVEHWLNGQKLLAYDMNSDNWQQMVAASKFADMPGFGQSRRGRIALQDHGDPVWFRNIRIRELGN